MKNNDQQEELFDISLKKNMAMSAPLSARMRPRTLEEFVGQKKTVGKNTVLRRLIESDNSGSLILWGPPGCGKTTLARIIAKESKAKFYPISAVASGVADLRKVVASARENKAMYSQKSILFIDEIHRFNKAQQDAILPFVESGLITLIGATTENPSFEVNNALLSRCRVYVMESLNDDDIKNILQKALNDYDRGMGQYNPEITEEAMNLLIKQSRGDARVALNTLEYAILSSVLDSETNKRIVTVESMEEALCFRSVGYDKSGDNHYDTISAFIKSMRNSDPNATVYWLARMIEGGEDPLFIARRMIIFASEDVGLGDPHALPLAVSAFQGVHSIGMPEGRILLSEVACYLATAPKNNSSYMAINSALEDVRNGKIYPVPKHLRNAVTDLMKNEGYGQGYKYAHDYEDHKTDMVCLPEELKDKKYFIPQG